MSADSIAELVASIRPVDRAAHDAALARHDGLAKPPGSLGQLEHLGARLAAIGRRCPPVVPRAPVVVVAAADHGVHAQGISPWPQEITATMVEVMCSGGAAINALAEAVGAIVAVVDVGCARAPTPNAALRSRRVRAGTADLSRGPAMTLDEAQEAVQAGFDVATQLLGSGAGLIVLGDMGIANTTATACLIAALTGCDPAAAVGPGAGVVDATLAHKIAVVTSAIDLHRPAEGDALATLAALGGLEHAALVGVILAAAAHATPVILDGVITNAAALAAVAVCPDACDYLIAGHRSTEPGARIALEHLGLAPLLDLDLRLGEGSGGVLAVPLVRGAAAVLNDMASLADL